MTMEFKCEYRRCCSGGEGSTNVTTSLRAGRAGSGWNRSWANSLTNGLTGGLVGRALLGLIFLVPALGITQALAVPSAAAENLSIGVTLEPPHLDPTAGAAAAIDEVVYNNLFQGLTRIDRNGAVTPSLATSWTVSEDGKTYTFKLRQGVLFHNGTQLKAWHVVFSLDRINEEGSENAQKALYSLISSVKADGDYRVIIELSEPDGLLPWKLGWGDAVIVEPTSSSRNKRLPVGTGPFAFDSFRKGDLVKLVKFEKYWGGEAQLDSVTWHFLPDAASQVAALLSGDVDGVTNIGAPEAIEQLRADSRFRVSIGTTEGETILAMNHRRGPLQDVRVRRAISHAIDRKAVIVGAMFGFGTPIGSHFAPHHEYYSDMTHIYPYDPDKAKNLLESAGYGDGLKLVAKLPPPTYARRGGEIIANQLKNVGIELELVPVEWAQWLSDVFRGEHDFDLTIISHTEPLDISIYSQGEEYYFGWQSGRFNEVMNRINLASESDELAELYAEAQLMLADEAVNAFLFELARVSVWRKEVQGVWVNAPIQATDVTEIFIR